jgi:hypothetical protein
MSMCLQTLFNVSAVAFAARDVIDQKSHSQTLVKRYITFSFLSLFFKLKMPVHLSVQAVEIC